MQRITIFGDIHANLPALQAVLADIEERSLDNLYCLGDLVGYGVQPNQVVEKIRALDVPTIMGNYDQGVGLSRDECGCAYKTQAARELGKRSIAWTNAHTSDENKSFLRTLVAQIPLQMGDRRVLLVHGSPRKINEYLYPDRPEKSLERVMDAAGADVLVCGHTHLPYQRVLPSGRQVINAGSVGKPKDGDNRAGYIALGVEGREVTVEFLRVPYPVETAAAAINATEMPNEFAQMLWEARG